MPYCNFHNHLFELGEISKGYQSIVFHCHFSARRGPSAAQIFEETLRGTEGRPDILVLRGGFEKWYRLYNREAELYELI